MPTSNVHFQPMSRVKREMSRHAQKRSQQRGLAAETVDLLLAFGEREHDNHGGVLYRMTERALNKLQRVVGRSQRVDALAGVYVVMSADEQTVITLAHQYN
jgi:hypothetical protein